MKRFYSINSNKIRNGILLPAIIMIMLPLRLVAQVINEPLPEHQYRFFSELSLSSVSENGKWVVYNLSYDTAPDTLCVKSTKGSTLYKLTDARQPSFAARETFIALLPGEILHLVNLNSGRVSDVKNVINYEMPDSKKYLVAKSKDAPNILIIDSFTGRTALTLENVAEYTLNKESSMLAYTSSDKKSVSLLDLKEIPNEVSFTAPYAFGLTWQKKGSCLVYYTRSAENGNARSLGLYNLDQNNTLTYSIPKEGALSELRYIHSLSVSDDVSRVIITTIKPEVTMDPQVGPEVWNGNDKWLYPLSYYMDQELSVKYYWWKPESAPVPITDAELPAMRLSGKQNFALLHNPAEYEPQYVQYPYTDYYVQNLDTGETKLLVKNITTSNEWVSLSPYSDDVAYYERGDWWVYRPTTEKRFCLTCQIQAKWDNSSTNAMPPVQPYGIGGWSDDGTFLLIYDDHDIWQISLEKAPPLRLTKGFESAMVFRMGEKWVFPKQDVIRNGISIIFHGQSINDNSEDYFRYNFKEGLHRLSTEKGTVRQIRKTAHGDLAYIGERYDTPPHIYFAKRGEKQAKKIVETNSLQHKYLWGHSELISFEINKSTSKAALFYPAGYEKGKRYPMITYIYEELSNKLHQYSAPLQRGTVGFNVTDYTLNGYIVLMPDIRYQSGNPGISASESVIAAVDEVVRRGIADPEAIGLMGTSFGGYETGFILTQTNKFSAAVSGAGIYDLPSFYFTMSPDFLLMEAWRFENQIFRMGFPYFSNQQAYLNNSPLQHAPQITTPVLLWCGKKDGVVPWQQSLMFYNALKRLDKKVILLTYPEEYHAMSTEGNQVDLSRHARQWFDHFLKKQHSKWIASGTANPVDK